MFGQPTPFPWWLWVLAGLWCGGLIWRATQRQTGAWLDVLIVVYTALLAYMAETATTGAMPPVGGIRLIWWFAGAAAVGGAMLGATGSTPRKRDIGWITATIGAVALAVCLQAVELAVLCAVVGVIGWLRPTDAAADGDAAPQTPERWLIVAAATVVCVTWLGTVEFAFRTEVPRAGLSPRFTALPPTEAVSKSRGGRSSSITELALAAILVLIAGLDARPQPAPVEEEPA
jgi:hypothetical protein